MSPGDVKARVASIAACIDDPESAHSMEDSLHVDVLYSIFIGNCQDPVECARIALTTHDLEFPRWCA